MRIEQVKNEKGEAISQTVVLSRRNLEVLLAKLDGKPSWSACTIIAPAIYFPTFVKAEENDIHYAHSSRMGEPPGIMHPDTEEAIRE